MSVIHSLPAYSTCKGFYLFCICPQSAWKVLGDVDYLHHAMPPVNDDTSPRGCRRTPQDFVKEAQAAKDKSFLRVRASRRSYAHALHLDPSEGTFWGDVAASCYQESRLRKAYGGEKPSMVGKEYTVKDINAV